MEVTQEIIFPNKIKIYVLKDELGNIATGKTYSEALNYLVLRRKRKIVT